jgi:hypothetical protein
MSNWIRMLSIITVLTELQVLQAIYKYMICSVIVLPFFLQHCWIEKIWLIYYAEIYNDDTQ